MGYTLVIGEAFLAYDKDKLTVTIRAAPARHDGAPEQPLTGRANMLSPSYSDWRNFCSAVGLTTLFYDEAPHRSTPLLAQHPGAQALCRADLSAIRSAREVYERPNLGPTPVFHINLSRLLWLEFWVGWALDNCKIPIIENS